MMRRGPLDRYPVEWVLRQAAASQASGTVEFNGPEPMTVFLHQGSVCGVAAGVASQDPSVVARLRAAGDEARARHEAVGVLATRLTARVGWYYHDSLADGDVAGWRWRVAALLLDARVRGREDRSMVDWEGRTVSLRPTGEGISLGADAWAVVTALAQTLPAAELRVRLGWEGSRLAAALAELDRSGALPLPGPRPVLDLDLLTTS